MLSIANIKNAEQAATYYERDDYYLKKEGGQTQWWGQGAARLDLNGEVEPDAFRSLAAGKLPDGTELLSVSSS